MREASDSLRFAELRAKNVERCERFYHPFEEWSLQDWLMAVTGELGELANVLKHARRGQNTGPIATDGILDVVALGNEAADVVIYLDLLCARAGVDLGAAVRWKFNTVSRKRLRCDLLLERDEEECSRGGAPEHAEANRRADDRTGLGSTAAALEALADELPDQLRALAAELRGGPDEPPRVEPAAWGADVQERIEALASLAEDVVYGAADEVGAWAFDREDRDEDGADDDDCLRRRAEAADGVLERRRRETDEVDHA
ncbi:MAG: MazG-like family protein [Myxococcota bacterium]|nr:MazG-like family protein [Myxococcota bacterium]